MFGLVRCSEDGAHTRPYGESKGSAPYPAPEPAAAVPFIEEDPADDDGTGDPRESSEHGPADQGAFLGLTPLPGASLDSRHDPTRDLPDATRVIRQSPVVLVGADHSTGELLLRPDFLTCGRARVRGSGYATQESRFVTKRHPDAWRFRLLSLAWRRNEAERRQRDGDAGGHEPAQALVSHSNQAGPDGSIAPWARSKDWPKKSQGSSATTPWPLLTTPILWSLRAVATMGRTRSTRRSGEAGAANAGDTQARGNESGAL